MALLRPLLLDNVPSIQQSAALALGRLASYSDDLAEEIVSYEILPQLVYSLNEQNVNFSGYFIFTVTQRISINP
jgi:HEAT repeat protein